MSLRVPPTDPRTQSDACADGNHDLCRPWDEDCDCPCHEGGIDA